MKRITFIFIVLLQILQILAQDNTKGKLEDFDWNPVIDAIIWHESRGNANAVCGPYVGILQIAPIMVRECNNILKSRNEQKRFTLKDRYSPEKSKEMFHVIMSKYNKENDIDKACRIWQGGTRYSVKKTQRFVNEIHTIMKQQKKQKEKQANEKKK